MAPDEKSGMAIISELKNMAGVSGIQYIIISKIIVAKGNLGEV